VPLSGRNAAAAGIGGGITINFNAPFFGGRGAVEEIADELAMAVKRRMHVNF
jgi:hypothetical protein